MLLCIVDKPEVTVEAGNSIVIDEYQSLDINCSVKAKPAATVKWMKGMEPRLSS